MSDCNLEEQRMIDSACKELETELAAAREGNKKQAYALTEFKVLCDKLKLELESIEAQNKRMGEELLKVEYGKECRFCPSCGFYQDHDPNCTLGILCAEIREGKI